jgi:hypothetical protein
VCSQKRIRRSEQRRATLNGRRVLTCCGIGQAKPSVSSRKRHGKTGCHTLFEAISAAVRSAIHSKRCSRRSGHRPLMAQPRAVHVSYAASRQEYR